MLMSSLSVCMSIRLLHHNGRSPSVCCRCRGTLRCHTSLPEFPRCPGLSVPNFLSLAPTTHKYLMDILRYRLRSKCLYLKRHIHIRIYRSERKIGSIYISTAQRRAGRVTVQAGRHSEHQGRVGHDRKETHGWMMDACTLFDSPEKNIPILNKESESERNELQAKQPTPPFPSLFLTSPLCPPFTSSQPIFLPSYYSSLFLPVERNARISNAKAKSPSTGRGKGKLTRGGI